MDKSTWSSEGDKEGNNELQVGIKEGWKQSRQQDIEEVVMARDKNKALNEETLHL